MSTVELPLKFNISAPHNAEGSRDTKWLKVGTATLKIGQDGKPKLWLRLNMIPGQEYYGFVDDRADYEDGRYQQASGGSGRPRPAAPRPSWNNNR